MPTYQYRCTACGHDLEVVQSFSDAALTECPACTGRLRKVFGSVGVVFKGSGFYKNDSRSGSSSAVPARSKEPTAASADSPAGGSSADGKSSDSGASSTSTPSSAPASGSSSSDSGSSSTRSGATSSTAAA